MSWKSKPKLKPSQQVKQGMYLLPIFTKYLKPQRREKIIESNSVGPVWFEKHFAFLFRVFPFYYRTNSLFPILKKLYVK